LANAVTEGTPLAAVPVAPPAGAAPLPAAATAPTNAAPPVAGEPRQSPFAEYAEIVGELWQFRHLIYQFARRDIVLRYKQAVMGFLWAVFMPLLIVASGFLVRFAVAQSSGGTLGSSSVAGIAVKSIAWAFFVGTLGFATTSLTGAIHLVSKVYFPREVLPLSATIGQMFDFGVGATALLFILPFLGVGASAALLWVPVLLLMLFTLTLAVALFASCGNLFYRDVKYIVQVLLTFGIFFTPVFFEPAMLGAKGAKLVMLNPLAPILEGLRLAVVERHNLLEPLMTHTPKGVEVLAWSPWSLAYSAVWAVVGLALSALMFHRLESAFAERA
jgi:lipopolysaccharide transport system permease protein